MFRGGHARVQVRDMADRTSDLDELRASLAVQSHDAGQMGAVGGASPSVIPG